VDGEHGIQWDVQLTDRFPEHRAAQPQRALRPGVEHPAQAGAVDQHHLEGTDRSRRSRRLGHGEDLDNFRSLHLDHRPLRRMERDFRCIGAEGDAPERFLPVEGGDEAAHDPIIEVGPELAG
jgi:hypothetical protein